MPRVYGNSPGAGGIAGASAAVYKRSIGWPEIVVKVLARSDSVVTFIGVDYSEPARPAARDRPLPRRGHATTAARTASAARCRWFLSVFIDLSYRSRPRAVHLA